MPIHAATPLYLYKVLMCQSLNSEALKEIKKTTRSAYTVHGLITKLFGEVTYGFYMAPVHLWWCDKWCYESAVLA